MRQRGSGSWMPTPPPNAARSATRRRGTEETDRILDLGAALEKEDRECINRRGRSGRAYFRGVAQLGLERCVRDAEVAGSNPVAPIT